MVSSVRSDSWTVGITGKNCAVTGEFTRASTEAATYIFWMTGQDTIRLVLTTYISTGFIVGAVYTTSGVRLSASNIANGIFLTNHITVYR